MTLPTHLSLAEETYSLDEPHLAHLLLACGQHLNQSDREAVDRHRNCLQVTWGVASELPHSIYYDRIKIGPQREIKPMETL